MKCPDLTELDSQSCKADARLDGTAAIDSIHTSVCVSGYMSPCLKVWSSYVPVNRHSDTAANRKDIPKPELTFAHTEGQCFSS